MSNTALERYELVLVQNELGRTYDMNVDQTGRFCLYSDFVNREDELLKKLRDLFRENQELKEEIHEMLKEMDDGCEDLSGFGL